MSTEITTTPTTETDLATATKFDSTIDHLRDLSRGALLKYALEVGKYLIDEYFAADITAYFDPSRSKESSFNALLKNREEELKELQLSPRTLRNYISAWNVWNSLPANVRQALDLTDLYELAAVQNQEERAKLANDAADNDWNLKQVKLAAGELKKAKNAGKKKRGPKEQPVYVLHFKEMDRQAEGALKAIRAAAPSGTDRDKAVAALAKLEAHVTAFKTALGMS